MHPDVGLTSARTRARMIARLRGEGIESEPVLQRMNTIRRHIFLESAVASQAYDDVAVPIGYGQTMSKPKVVARMTELALNGRSKVDLVLDVGCGSGYQAAILAGFARKIYAVERIGGLVARAQKAFNEEGINNIELIHGDGYDELNSVRKFDIIVVAAAPENVPEVLINALAIGGRLIIPVGTKTQRLEVYERTTNGVTRTEFDEVLFVPMLKGKR